MRAPPRLATMLLAAIGALALTACGSGEDAGIDDMLDTATAGPSASCPAPGQAWTDASITLRILSALAADPALRAWRIGVDTVDGKVVLHGRVASGPMRERATRLALAVPGVTLVDSLLDIHG
jgi:BON domain